MGAELEELPPLTKEEARVLQSEILSDWKSFQDRIITFLERDGWVALGFRTFGAWWDEELRPVINKTGEVFTLSLRAKARQKAIQALHEPDPDTGRQSTMAEIAEKTGVGKATVFRDLNGEMEVCKYPNKTQQRTLNNIPASSREDVWASAVKIAGSDKDVRAKHIHEAHKDIQSTITDEWTPDASETNQEDQNQAPDPAPESSEGDWGEWGRHVNEDGYDNIQLVIRQFAEIADVITTMADHDHDCVGPFRNCQCRGIMLRDLERDEILDKVKWISHTLERTRDKKPER